MPGHIHKEGSIGMEFMMVQNHGVRSKSVIPKHFMNALLKQGLFRGLVL